MRSMHLKWTQRLRRLGAAFTTRRLTRRSEHLRRKVLLLERERMATLQEWSQVDKHLLELQDHPEQTLPEQFRMLETFLESRAIHWAPLPLPVPQPRDLITEHQERLRETLVELDTVSPKQLPSWMQRSQALTSEQTPNSEPKL